MKSILFRMVAIIYVFVAMFILGAAMLYIFAISMGSPVWVCYILYPLALVIAATMPNVFGWLNEVA